MTLAQGSFSPPRGDAKRSYVKEMFTAIAPRYDFLNHTLSLNLDRLWRRRAVTALDWKRAPDGTYLDLCAGTLDLAVDLATRPGFRGHVVGADFVVPMLQRGVGKSPRVRPVGADALELPFPDHSFDGCMVGFGVRNLTDLDRGLEEIGRVLRPGGRLSVLECATPAFAPARAAYLLYFNRVLPAIGRLVSGHRTAYTYLPTSVAEFPDPEEFTRRIERSGFDAVSWRSLTLGTASLHSATKR